MLFVSRNIQRSNYTDHFKSKYWIRYICSFYHVITACWCVLAGYISYSLVLWVNPHFNTTNKDCKICCFSAKHAALRSKSKDWLTRNQDNVSEWSDMSIREQYGLHLKLGMNSGVKLYEVMDL